MCNAIYTRWLQRFASIKPIQCYSEFSLVIYWIYTIFKMHNFIKLGEIELGRLLYYWSEKSNF